MYCNSTLDLGAGLVFTYRNRVKQPHKNRSRIRPKDTSTESLFQKGERRSFSFTSRPSFHVSLVWCEESNPFYHSLGLDRRSPSLRLGQRRSWGIFFSGLLPTRVSGLWCFSWSLEQDVALPSLEMLLLLSMFWICLYFNEGFIEIFLDVWKWWIGYLWDDFVAQVWWGRRLLAFYFVDCGPSLMSWEAFVVFSLLHCIRWQREERERVKWEKVQTCKKKKIIHSKAFTLSTRCLVSSHSVPVPILLPTIPQWPLPLSALRHPFTPRHPRSQVPSRSPKPRQFSSPSRWKFCLTLTARHKKCSFFFLFKVDFKEGIGSKINI